MRERLLGAVILAAGKGTRMKSRRPKVLHPLAGRPMILHLLDTIRGLTPARLAVVVGPDMDEVAAAVAPCPSVVQSERLGTGHAVMAAREIFDGFTGDVLVLYGDTPLLRRETIESMLEVRAAEPHPAVVVLGMRAAEPNAYGRLVTGDDCWLESIVEWEDATPAQRALPLSNSGVMLVDGGQLLPLLDAVGNENASREYYLTDIVAIARSRGLHCAYVEADESELLGINSRAELATAESAMQARLRRRAMDAGATLLMPETVYFTHDTQLGCDVTIGPFVTFGPGVTVGDDVEIKGFCHLEGATIATGATVGPYARLRPGADIASGAHIGNFVEVKNARIETDAKVNHLTYIGDARVGAGANVGAGTITCNYDGYAKNFTDIGAGAFIGSNACLVAPVRVGDNAFVAAGSTIGADVPADALVVTRAAAVTKPGWTPRYRARKTAEKQRHANGGIPQHGTGGS